MTNFEEKTWEQQWFEKGFCVEYKEDYVEKEDDDSEDMIPEKIGFCSQYFLADDE